MKKTNLSSAIGLKPIIIDFAWVGIGSSFDFMNTKNSCYFDWMCLVIENYFKEQEAVNSYWKDFHEELIIIIEQRSYFGWFSFSKNFFS